VRERAFKGEDEREFDRQTGSMRNGERGPRNIRKNRLLVSKTERERRRETERDSDKEDE